MGLDLNPAMVIVAKAQLLGQDVFASIAPLAKEITDSMDSIETSERDPLCSWFKPGTASLYRSLENAISTAVVAEGNRDFTNAYSVSKLSTLASFYYLSLFRSVRKTLTPFLCSNPTWIRTSSAKDRISSSRREVIRRFHQELRMLRDASQTRISQFDKSDSSYVNIVVGDARLMTAQSNTTDIVIGSPPYCTRIDYAIATRPELAILGIGEETGFDTLRKSLTGTVLTRNAELMPSDKWGRISLLTIDQVSRHGSRASSGYYANQFLQYFSDLSKSLAEIQRVLKPDGKCILVIQDTLYKDIHVDLPTITAEMAERVGLSLVSRQDFRLPTSLRNVNSRSRRYRKQWNATESVLEFAN